METVKDYKANVKKAKKVFCTPRFGATEKLIKLSKVDALWLVNGYSDDETAKSLGMYAEDSFGYFDNEDYIIG